MYLDASGMDKKTLARLFEYFQFEIFAIINPTISKAILFS